MNNLQSDIDSPVCDGYGCYSRAKSELVVKVGSKKTISLYLCEGCKTKFNDHGRTDVMIQQQNSEVQLTEHNPSADMTDEQCGHSEKGPALERLGGSHSNESQPASSYKLMGVEPTV